MTTTTQHFETDNTVSSTIMEIADEDRKCVSDELFGTTLCGGNEDVGRKFDIVLIHLCARDSRYNDRCYLVELALRKIYVHRSSFYENGDVEVLIIK